MKELVDLLVSNLKVDPRQASGGAAVLLKAAQDRLGAREFGSMVGGVPGLDELIRQAPQSGGVGKLFGGFASALGGGNAAAIASIVSGFGQLGLTPDHAKRFAPVILEFLRGKIGKENAAKLEQTLRAGF